MPAPSRLAWHPRPRASHLLAVGLAALFLASSAAFAPAPAEARDWTPRIKSARAAQVYWESVMRRADAQVRQSRLATRRARVNLKRSKSRLRTAHDRRIRARSRMRTARADVRQARADVRRARRPGFATAAPGEAPPPAPSSPPATPALALRLAGLEHVAGAAAPLLPEATFLAFLARDDHEEGVSAAAQRQLKLLERRVRKQQRAFQRTRRKEQRAWRSVRQAQARRASVRRSKRSAVARREAAERSLGSWILAMETYARGRARNMATYRPGVDSPFAWPARGRISQSYSARHDGLDIVSYQGAPIRAAAFGVVAYVGWNPWDEHGRAFMVVVAHVGGLETLYGHVLPRRSVRVGQAVRKGEVIGYMGNTGNSTGTHLHFEVRRGRSTVNPLGYL